MRTVTRDEFAYWSHRSVKGRRHDADGWKHKPCGQHADTEHNGRECSSCKNWGGCGGGCDVSGIVCPRCEVRADHP